MEHELPRRLVRRLVVLVGLVFLLDTSLHAAVTPLLPRFVETYGWTDADAGLVAGGYAAGILVAALPAGWLAARVGVRATMLFGLALLAGASVALGLGGSLAVLLGSRVVQGVGGAFSFAAGMAWLIGHAPPDRRGALVGFSVSAAMAGALLGPVIGALAMQTSAAIVFPAIGVLSAAVALLLLPVPAVVAEAPPTVRRLVRGLSTAPVVLGMWATALLAGCSGIVQALGPLRLDELGVSETGIAATFLVSAGLAVIVGAPVGRLADRHGRVRPLRVGLVVAAVLTALLAAGSGAASTTLLVAVGSACLVVLLGPSMAQVSDGAHAAGFPQAVAWGVVNLVWAAGQMLGAAGAGQLGELGLDGVAYGTGAAACVLTALWPGRPVGGRRSSAPSHRRRREAPGR